MDELMLNSSFWEYDPTDPTPINSSTLMDTSEEVWEIQFRDLSRFLVHKVFVPIVVFIGILGNLITIYILTRRPMRSSTNVYLCSLALSDFLFLTFTLSLSLSHYEELTSTCRLYWLYKPIGLWLNDASSSTSVWITVSFTIERYIAVCHPMRGKVFCTEERAIRVAVMVYLFCFLATSPTPFEWTIANKTTIFNNDTVYTLVNTEFGSNETYVVVYNWFSSIMFTLLPVFILIIFNYLLILAVRQSRIVRKAMTNLPHSSVRHLQTMRQENRITITLIAVVIVFLICQLPTAIFLIYGSFHQPETERQVAFLRGIGGVFNLLVSINASCNFLLYTALSDKYRKYFCNFLLCWRRGRSGGRRTRRGIGRSGFDNPYEMESVNTTVSLSRAASLRPDQSTSCQITPKASPFGLRRNQSCQSGGYSSRNDTSRTQATSKRSNKPYHIKDGTIIPLIQVDHV